MVNIQGNLNVSCLIVNHMGMERKLVLEFVQLVVQ
jgi:hypothetical protein